MILFGVAAVGTTACTMCLALATTRLTDAHHRLRLDRLLAHNHHAAKWLWCAARQCCTVIPAPGGIGMALFYLTPNK